MMRTRLFAFYGVGRMTRLDARVRSRYPIRGDSPGVPVDFKSITITSRITVAI